MSHGGARPNTGRPVGSYDPTSVRTRLMDLLETFNGEWLNLGQLEHEYSERFGPVKRETIRRTVYRILRQDDQPGRLWCRSVDHGLEVLYSCDDSSSEAIDVVARNILHVAFREWVEEGWEALPDVCEADYLRIVEAGKAALPHRPSLGEWNAAMENLEARVEVADE